MPGTEQDSTLEALQSAYDKLLDAWSENQQLRTLLGLRAGEAIPSGMPPSPAPAPNSQVA